MKHIIGESGNASLFEEEFKKPARQILIGREEVEPVIYIYSHKYVTFLIGYRQEGLYRSGIVYDSGP